MILYFKGNNNSAFVSKPEITNSFKYKIKVYCAVRGKFKEAEDISKTIKHC